MAGPGQILGSGAVGRFALSPDLTALPQGQGSVAAMAGDTWRFQAWFRDVEPGPIATPTSNFTAGLAVTLN